MSKESQRIKELEERNEFLEKRFDYMQRGNRLNTYLAIDGQISSFNAQLIIGDEKIIKGEDGEADIKVRSGYIDLFADKDAKEFDRAKWFFFYYMDLIKSQSDLYKMLTEEEKKEADNTTSEFDSVREKIAKELNGGGKAINN